MALVSSPLPSLDALPSPAAASHAVVMAACAWIAQVCHLVRRWQTVAGIATPTQPMTADSIVQAYGAEIANSILAVSAMATFRSASRGDVMV